MDVVIHPFDRGPEYSEAWYRTDETDEYDHGSLHDLGAARRRDDAQWPWVLSVAMGDILYGHSLLDELVMKIEAAVRAVPGVTDVLHDKYNGDDWQVAGEPSGEALLRAAAAVVDALAERANERLIE